MKATEPDVPFVVVGADPYLIRACADRAMSSITVREVSQHLRGGDPLPTVFDEVVVPSISDVGDVWAGLRRIVGDGSTIPVRGIVTSNEFSVSTVAALAQLLEVPGVSLESATLMRDKYLQKQAVRRAGVNVADSDVIVAGSAKFRTDFARPSVIKPLSGAGATHLEVVTTEDEYDAAVARMAAAGAGPLVVEQLIDVHEEWCVDGVVQDGVLVFSSVARYNQPAIAYTTGRGPERLFSTFRMDGTEEQARCDEARSLAARALAALQYHNGVFHLELLLDSRTDEFFFGECAARRGGVMIEDEVRVKHGVSLAAAAVEIALGEPFSGKEVLNERHVGFTHLYLPRGTIMKLPDEERFCSPDHIHALHITALLGVNDNPTVWSTASQQAMCVVSGESREELAANMAAARSAFVEQSLVAPTFETKAKQREFMSQYEDRLRRLL